MSATQPASFTREDLTALAEAHERIEAFKRFLLARFIAYTNTVSGVTTTMGRPVPPVDNAEGRTSNGWGRWRIGAHPLFPAPEAYAFEHYLDDERAPSALTGVVLVPTSFILAEEGEQDDYATFLALKARFEPTQ